MYSLLILFIIIFIPMPIMTRLMLSGKSAYRGVFEGTVTAVTGITLVLLLSWAMTGISLLDAMNQIMSNISAESMSLAKSYESFGMKNMSPDQLQNALDQVKEIMKLAVPGTLIVMASVVTYINYGVLSRIMKKFNTKVAVLPPFRNFTLPKSIVIGSIIIYALSFLVINMGMINRELMMLTIQIVFSFVFAVQGLAVLFYVGYVKKIPVIFTFIIALVFLFTWFGQTFLFLLGLLDIVMDIRKRFSQTKLK